MSMSNERHESIKDHYKMAKREGASLHYTMVGDCLDEIERLRKLVKSAHREGMKTGNTWCGSRNFNNANTVRLLWDGSEARKALET